MSEFRPLRNFINRLFGPPKASRPTATRIPQPSQGAKSQLIHPHTEADKGLANAGNIKTFGTGLERMDVYGAIPLTRERIQAGAQEAKNEAEVYEKEISAPIMSFQGRSEFGATMGGIGLTDPAIARSVQQWEAEQRALLAPLKIPEITSTSPVKTFRN